MEYPPGGESFEYPPGPGSAVRVSASCQHESFFRRYLTGSRKDITSHPAFIREKGKPLTDPAASGDSRRPVAAIPGVAVFTGRVSRPRRFFPVRAEG